MKIYKCDRCGAEYDPTDDILIPLDNFESSFQITEFFFDGNGKRHKFKLDLCQKCIDELGDWLVEPILNSENDSEE